MPGPGTDLVAEVIRILLLVASPFAFGVALGALVSDAPAQSSALTLRLALLALIAVAALGLTRSRYPARWLVRTFELLIFGALAASLALSGHARLLAAAAQPEMLLGAWQTVLLHVILLMGGYALFVPNGPLRAAFALTLLALVPFAALLSVDAEFASSLWPDSALLLAIAVIVGVASSTLFGVFRKAALEGREQRLYTLSRRIGSGAMGDVWLARHGVLKRIAAIKVIRPERLSGDPEEQRAVTERFQQEARSTAALRSPHTVEVYDFGVTGKGLFYYVMEYLDGIDLETLVERFGPVPSERAVYLLLQVCKSLADAHSNGLIHRDVKPANIHIARQGGSYDMVKVLDFGLARREAEVDPEGNAIASGTPAYMAPEVARGEGDAGALSDLYAVGCVAYWLLTGELVFRKATIVDVLVAHVSEAPVPPSERGELPIDPDLEAIVMRCLAKAPADRYASMLELHDALDALTLPRPWTPRRAQTWWQRHLPAAPDPSELPDTAPRGAAQLS